MDKDMAFRKPCPRTLDRPIAFFGLEVEDLLAVLAIAGALLFTAGPIAGIVSGATLWFGLARIKRGKPPGHLTALLYSLRVFNWIPLGPPHLIRADWDRDGHQHFSAAWASRDGESPHGRAYWPGGRA